MEDSTLAEALGIKKKISRIDDYSSIVHVISPGDVEVLEKIYGAFWQNYQLQFII